MADRINSDAPLSGFLGTKNGQVNKVALYTVASVISFAIYAYLIKKYVDTADRLDHVKNNVMSATAGYGTHRALDAATRYLVGA
jgi:hypothetical protein